MYTFIHSWNKWYFTRFTLGENPKFSLNPSSRLSPKIFTSGLFMFYVWRRFRHITQFSHSLSFVSSMENRESRSFGRPCAHFLGILFSVCLSVCLSACLSVCLSDVNCYCAYSFQWLTIGSPYRRIILFDKGILLRFLVGRPKNCSMGWMDTLVFYFWQQKRTD